MKSKRKTERNWLLVIVASLLIVIGAVLVLLAVSNIHAFGWWSLAIGVGGLTTATAACIAIIENDPTWILLDFMWPL